MVMVAVVAVVVLVNREVREAGVPVYFDLVWCRNRQAAKQAGIEVRAG